MGVKDFTGVFEVEVKARKLKNGHRMQIILERPYDAEEFAAILGGTTRRPMENGLVNLK